MRDNPFFKTIQNIFGKRIRASEDTQSVSHSPLTQNETAPAIYIRELTFRDGTKLSLKKDSIVVLTGPNNSGKSSVLISIADALSSDARSRPVVAGIDFAVEGTESEFREFIRSRTFRAAGEDDVWVDRYKTYELANVNRDMSKAFKGAAVSGLFFSRLNAEARLSSVRPARREDWTQGAPTEPLLWLDFEVETETFISSMFERAFGFSLWVNRTAGEKIILHVCDQDPPNFDDFRTYRDWVARLPTLESQGDGMKSFAAALLAIKVHPKSLILLDEPEAFLHDPQAVKLAGVITTETSPSTQIWVATHSDDIVRGLLDSSTDRIVVVRLDRIGNESCTKVLEPEQVKVLWADPLLRTSDVLSALFHEVAVICEGGTDVRFFRALADANKASERLPDFKLYHVGGKDKIVSIASALRALNLPVCVMCDLDILADSRKFIDLYSILGGVEASIAADVRHISQHVNQRNTMITGEEAARRLRSIAQSAEKVPKMSASQRSEISTVLRESSAWSRLKVDGYRGLENATIVQAFQRVYANCKELGLLINREGELESLCREAPQTSSSAWIEDVLTRDLTNDPCLEDARTMLTELRNCIKTVRQSALRSGQYR